MRTRIAFLVACTLIATGGGCPNTSATFDPNVNPATPDASRTSPWGICAHVPEDATLDLIEQAGIRWVRTNICWDLVEPVRGQYNWDYLDERIAAMRARGLHVFATIERTPSWAADSNDPADPPRDPNDWARFVRTAVTRYRADIEHWGMWNEPNGGDQEYWTGTPTEFREIILIPGSTAAREADPNCLVVGPSITVHTNWSTDWMNVVMANGGADAIDIVELHVYAQDADEVFWNIDARSDSLDDILPVMNVLQSLGIADKPLWVTETGWATSGAHAVDEATQAAYYAALLAGVQQRSATIERVFPYAMIDDPEGAEAFGIVRADYTPKPAYTLYREFLADSITD